MSFVSEIMKFNKKFVEGKFYEPFKTTKYPDKKIAIVSCMDTRLTDLLPAALNYKNGDIKIIKVAGSTVTNPYGSVMQSLAVAVYEFDVEDILVIGHTGCGMENMDKDHMISLMKKRLPEEAFAKVAADGIDLKEWLGGFDDIETAIADTVRTIKEHPLMPEKIRVHGFILDTVTGKLDALK